ncbi:reverse transcriptase domain-containing protein, partial [Tanacetum coccineum]
SQVKSSDVNSSSSSDIAKLTHAVNQQTNAVTTAMTAILKQFQATPPPASVKAVEEDNIQGYVSAAAVNYNQGNSGYRPPAPIQQNQSVPLSELEKIKKTNEANMKAMQNQINNVKNELRNEMQNSIQTSMSNQTNELKNMMTSFFQMNTASTSGTGSLSSKIVANPKGELKAITTRSGLVLDGPTFPMPPPFVNLEEDQRVEETLMDQEHGEFTFKVPPLFVQKAKPLSQRNYMVHQKDARHPHIPYPSRMNQEKQKEKDEVQIHKFWQMFKQLHINITLADALIPIPKYQKMPKSLLSNKEKLLELENIPLNENCSAVILKKLPEKLGDPRKFLIPCGFSELKCKALADLGIARDVFVLVGKFTFLADFVIIDYESDPRVPLVLGRPFLRTARALIDVHGEEMILRDGNERLTLNMRHDTSSYSNEPHQQSINMIDVYNVLHEDYREDLFVANHPSGNPTSPFSSHTDLTSSEVNDDIFDPEEDITENLLNLDKTKDLPPYHDNQLSGNLIPISEPETKSSSSSPTLIFLEESNLIWEEFKAYLA